MGRMIANVIVSFWERSIVFDMGVRINSPMVTSCREHKDLLIKFRVLSDGASEGANRTRDWEAYLTKTARDYSLRTHNHFSFISKISLVKRHSQPNENAPMACRVVHFNTH